MNHIPTTAPNFSLINLIGRLGILTALAGVLGCVGNEYTGDSDLTPPINDPAAEQPEAQLAEDGGTEIDSQPDEAGETGEVDPKSSPEGGTAPVDASPGQSYADVAADSELQESESGEVGGPPVLEWVLLSSGVVANPATGVPVAVDEIYIANLETTVALAHDCYDAGECSLLAYPSTYPCDWREGSPDQPVVCIDHYQAEQVCAYLGGRLPMEVELALAAAPLGVTPDGACWRRNDGPCDVGTHPSDEVFGVYDLRGNISEWTTTSFDWSPTRSAFGGAWADAYQINRREVPKSRRSPTLGVRCVKNVSNATP